MTLKLHEIKLKESMFEIYRNNKTKKKGYKISKNITRYSILYDEVDISITNSY